MRKRSLLKVALFTDTYTPEANGVAVAVATLAGGLRGRGHEVTVFAPSHPDAVEEEGLVRLPSIVFKPFPDHRLATPVDLSVVHHIKEAGFDLVHTHTEFSVGQFGFRAAAQLKIPQVHTYHTAYEDYTWYVTRGQFEKQMRKFVTMASKYVCDRCDAIIAPTAKTRDMLLAYDIDVPIHVVPTGVDCERFSQERVCEQTLRDLRAALGIAPQAKVLLSLGRVAYEKNLVKLMDSVADYFLDRDPALAAQRRDAVFLVVGDGLALKDLRKQAAERGITDRVFFTGTIDWEDVPRYYHLSDVFVSMSETETQGLTFIEAIAAGCPVVAQYNECFDGILTDGESASLFEGTEEFPARLDEMLFTDRRARYIEEGQRTIQALSIETFAKRMEDIYQQTRATYTPRLSTLRRVFS